MRDYTDKSNAQPADGVPEATREAMRDAIAEALGDAYDCTRVWSAWSIGTMTQDDFQLVTDDEERLEEIVDAALSVLAPVHHK